MKIIHCLALLSIVSALACSRAPSQASLAAVPSSEPSLGVSVGPGAVNVQTVDGTQPSSLDVQTSRDDKNTRVHVGTPGSNVNVKRSNDGRSVDVNDVHVRHSDDGREVDVNGVKVRNGKVVVPGVVSVDTP